MINTIYKIEPKCSFSGKGKLWEYYHCLIEFCPRILYYCFTNSKDIYNINIIIPNNQDTFLHTHPNNKWRTMKHIIDTIFDEKINIISLDTKLINYPTIPFPLNINDLEGEPLWGNDNPNIFLKFQNYIIDRNIKDRNIIPNLILILKRGSINNCADSSDYNIQNGKERRCLPDDFFLEATQYLKKKKKNFKIVELENLPFIEQVRLFYQSKVVIGIHGGGLSNIIFCQKGIKVLELGPRLVPCYKNLSHNLKLKYYYQESHKFLDCLELNLFT